MQAEPMLSFGVPMRNGARFFRRLITSLEAQDFDDFEVVVCDNQSTDETGDIVREFARRDAHFEYFLNETNIGQIENFNRLVDRSRGRYVRRIGSDDWLEPSSALRCVEALEANPDAVGVTTRWRHVDEEGTRVLALELAIDGPFCRVHDCLATRRIAREPAKVRLARYHSTIKELKHASEVRLAPCWTMYRDLAKVVINSSLSPLDRALGTALVVTFGGLHHVRALGERAIKLVGQRQGAATTA